MDAIDEEIPSFGTEFDTKIIQKSEIFEQKVGNCYW